MSISLIFQLLGFALKIFGASKETNEKFLALIKASENDGLITVQARDKFVAQREAILKKIQADIEKKEGPK